LNETLINAQTALIKPELFFEVKYTELPEDGLMRRPSFQGTGEDKKAKEVPFENDMVVLVAHNLKSVNGIAINEIKVRLGIGFVLYTLNQFYERR
jgi:hypothetical protein